MNQNINLNLIPDGVNPVVTASQYDEKRVITFTLYDGTSAYTIPNGTEIEVRGLKGDDKVFIYNEDDLLPDNTPIVSWSGNVITVNTALQMTACYGDVLTQFKLTNGGMTIATLNFVLRVQRDPAANGDISETELPAIIAEATEQMRRAEAAAVVADGRAEDSEAWAIGTRDGSPVGSSDPTYHNNSKYYSDEAGDAKTAAETAQGLAETAQGKAEDAQTAAETAQGKAEDAQTAAESAQTAAETSELNAEAWAVGTKDGTAVPSTDPQYHNNSKYWSDLAAQYAAQFGSAVKWRGSVAFANIPTSGMANGDLYDITDSFTTDSRFVIGSGVSEPAGTDIIWNETASKWDIDTPSGVTSFNGRMGAVTPQSGDYSKGDVGLGNVDNTSDLNKPISTATQTALDGKMKKATGTAGQFVGYDSNGDPEAQSLPVMTGATTLADGTMGMLPAPTIADKDKFFGGDGAWHTPAGSGSGHTIMDENENTFTNRPVLQFMDSDVTDDSEHDRTIITPHGGTTIVQIPSVVGTTFTYTGSAIGPQVTGLDTEHITITGATATNVGSYTLTAALNDPSRMVWTDMTTADKTFVYTITKMPITIPTVTGSFTYDGTEKSCTISPASSDYYTQTGTTASTNAGTFSITFELNDTANTEWSDGTITDKVKNWSIAKATPTLTVSPASVTIQGYNNTATSTVTYSGDGTLSVSSSSSSIATASISGTTVTMTCKGSGTATITIRAADNTNYNSKTTTITVQSIKVPIVTFHDGTESQIAAMLTAYYNNEITWAEMGWAVGDTRVIHFDAMTAPTGSSGTWAAQYITVVIVAHDHTDLATAINGHTKACITVQTRECMNNNTESNGQTGHIYLDGYSATGFTSWKNMYARTYLNSTVLSALSSGDFKNSIKPSIHYRHAASNTNVADEVTDTLFLPSYPELDNNNTYTSYVATSPSEGTTFSYYTTASNRVKSGNNNGSSNGVGQFWWVGSPASSNTVWIAIKPDTGDVNGTQKNVKFALAPAWAM